MIDEFVDIKEVEALCQAQWPEIAFFTLTAPEAARFVVWRANTTLRPAGLEFVPRLASLHSWQAMLDELAAFLFPLIVAGRHIAGGSQNEVIRKTLEQLEALCSRVHDPSLGERGPWEHLIVPLLERGFAAGKNIPRAALLPYLVQGTMTRWKDHDPFEREEAAFTREASAMLVEMLGKAGLDFDLPQGRSISWCQLCGELTVFIIPHIAAPEPAPVLGEALTELFRLTKKAERGDVGYYRASTLCRALIHGCWDAPYPFKLRADQPKYYGGWRVDGLFTLTALVPEFASLLFAEQASLENQQRMEESGY